MVDKHLSTQFDSELNGVSSRVMELGGLVESQIRQAIYALAQFNAEAASQVLATEERVNQKEVEIDRELSSIIARRQPTARDLRLLMAISKTTANLERVGDEAERIARIAEKLGNAELPEHYAFKLAQMGSLVRDQLRGTLDTFARMDETRALERLRRDREVDVLYKELTRLLVDLMQRESERVPAALEMLWGARALERIGDRCKNICEQVIYLVRGKDVRHTGLSRSAAPLPETKQ